MAGTPRTQLVGDDERMLDDLLGVEGGLSAWEMDFLDSVDRQRDRGLTAGQLRTMREIGDELSKEGFRVARSLRP